MNDVKWIKITTDMFDNRKIKHIRKLPDGNSIVLVWVMLLTLAGRCNAGGMIMLTEKIPYTEKMLADELGFEETTITLALKAFEEFDMVSRESGCVYVLGWEEHQNLEGLNKMREDARLRKQRQRERQKLIGDGKINNDVSRDGHVTVTRDIRDCHATEKEIDKDIDIDIYKTDRYIDLYNNNARTRARVNERLIISLYGKELAELAFKCLEEMSNAEKSCTICGKEYTPKEIRARAEYIDTECIGTALDVFKQKREGATREKGLLYALIFRAPDELGKV